MADTTKPTIVWVLFHETNTGHSDESDGWVEGVYATEADADAAMLAAIRAAVEDGSDVYWNPDAPEGEQEGPSDWTDDWRVEPHQVLGARPADSGDAAAFVNGLDDPQKGGVTR